MDFLDKLVGGQGCAPDGAATASNPLGQVVDTLLPLQQDPWRDGEAGHEGGDPQALYAQQQVDVSQDLQALGDDIFAREMAARDAWEADFRHGGWQGPQEPEMRPAWQQSAEEAWSGAEAKVAQGNAFDAAWDAEQAGAAGTIESAWGASGEGLAHAWDVVAENGLGEEAWGEAKIGGAEGAWQAAAGGMAEAWKEAAVERDLGGPSQAGLDAAWARTQERLEAMGSDEYELGEMNEFDALDDACSAGVELFRAGQLGKAVQAFEAAIRQDPSDTRAWRLLGVTHAENEEDVRAIQCLERAVGVDPYNLEALVALGVSYVNEMNPEKALANLKGWLEANPKFAALEVQPDEYSDGSLMDEVQSLMLQAAAHDPNDADVQVVLGVVYNVTQDFSSATNAFERALASRPDDYALYNKLGATLANADAPEAGLAQYQRAVDIKPRYARAWLNMGISHSNLGAEEEAARCFLTALDLNPNARHIWPFLRVVFTNMGRYDLVERAGREVVDAFREEFRVGVDSGQ